MIYAINTAPWFSPILQFTHRNTRSKEAKKKQQQQHTDRKKDSKTEQKRSEGKSKDKQQTARKKKKKNTARRHRYKKFTSLSLARIHLDEHPKCSQRSQQQHQVPLRIYECERNSATGYKVSAQTIVRVDVRYIYLLTCAL